MSLGAFGDASHLPGTMQADADPRDLRRRIMATVPRMKTIFTAGLRPRPRSTPRRWRARTGPR